MKEIVVIVLGSFIGVVKTLLIVSMYIIGQQLVKDDRQIPIQHVVCISVISAALFSFVYQHFHEPYLVTFFSLITASIVGANIEKKTKQ